MSGNPSNNFNLPAVLFTTMGLTLAQRMLYFSKLLLNRKFVHVPLGDGPGSIYDERALFSFDKFDCLTYIETIVALSHAQNEDDFETQLNRVRYSGATPHFLKRNRFLHTQWLPNIERKKLLQNISAQVTGSESVLGTRLAEHNHRLWHDALVRELNATGFNANSVLTTLESREPFFLKTLRHKVKYIPISAFFYEEDGKQKINTDLVSKIPGGSVILFFKLPRHTHMAIAVWKGNRLYMRHACNMRNRTVEDLFGIYLLSAKMYGFFEEILIYSCP